MAELADAYGGPTIARRLETKTKDLGGFTVRRVLPQRAQRMVGPFIFFDHMGPADFPAGQGINVRPHPHIGLATVTYLLEGSILHRDSLGSVQEIFPGDVNWMTAGKGIVHSERETLEVRSIPHRLDGMQCWLALPEEKEEIEPSFLHVKKNELPHIMYDGIMMRLIAGEAFGRRSQIKTHWPMFYLDVVAAAGAVVEHPNLDAEAAVYVQRGEVTISGQVFSKHDFVVLEPNDHRIQCHQDCRFLLLGGRAFEKRPHIDWNFVAADPARIKEAKRRWRAGEFPTIPGDDAEFIPLN